MKKYIVLLIAALSLLSCKEISYTPYFTCPLWRGERMGAVVELEPQTDMKGCTLKVLNAPAKADFLFDVIGDELGDADNLCGGRPEGQYKPIVVADRIGPETGIDIYAGNKAKVWLQLDIPRKYRPGHHKGTLVAKSEDGKKLCIPFEYTVADKTLPKPAEWHFHLDLWQNPYAVARYFDVPLWSEEHFNRLRPLMELLASAGQKVVTATILDRPWNGQTEDPFGSMVVKIKAADGSWSYDYTAFDKWVEFMFSLGIDSQINCYSMIPWSLQFDYLDAESGETGVLVAKPGSEEYAAYWSSFLNDFVVHLKEKGWFEKTAIAMDEREEADMAAALAIIKAADPDMKISMAGNYHKTVEPELYDMCFDIHTPAPAGVLERRREEGKISTWYVSCSSRTPNIFLACDPMEAVWMGWYSAAMGLDGMLRWAYNSWTADPAADARFRTWPAGDCFFVYPEGSSVRMQRLIEGIQDYEKVCILRQEGKDIDSCLSMFNLENLREFGPEPAIISARQALQDAVAR